MATTKKGTFVQKVLGTLNKTEKQKQQESVEEFVKDAIIETQSQISTLEVSELAKANLELERAQNALNKAKSAKEAVKYSIPDSGLFEDYFYQQEQARKSVYNAEQNVKSKEAAIEVINSKLEVFKEILETLKG